MVSASKLRSVVRMMGFACGGCSLSKEQIDDDHMVIHSNISSSKKEIASTRRIDTESSSPGKNLCAICLEPLNYSTCSGSPGQAIFTSQCSHTFHFTCISSNVRHGSVTCPICRAYWTQLPRDLHPAPVIIPSNQEDPILRILDDSIATSRVHRRSSLRAVRYDDDDPIEPDLTPVNDRLQITLAVDPHSLSSLPYQFTSSSSLSSLSPNGQKPYECYYNRACLSVKLAHQQATDLVLVASPNGPHLRLLKQSMALIVFSLRAIDRLAIVTYSSTASRVFPLRRMTSHWKKAALQVINRMIYLGEADPSPGLKKAIKILQDRAHINPQSNILHLSDNPLRSNYIDFPVDIPILIHRFHVGFGYGTSNAFVMREFEEFLARLLGGVIRDTQLMIILNGQGGEIIKIGELRGGEERNIVLELCGRDFVRVSYSYIEGRNEECLKTGEIVLKLDDKSEESETSDGEGLRDNMNVGTGRISSAEGWEYHDPYMARRWARHLHGYRF